MNDLLINIGIVSGSIILGVVLLYVLLVAVFYRKITQGKALVRTGMGSTKVAFEGMYVVPLLHTAETMDISLKQVVISREGKDGLICKDNIRADIKVVYFVRVNATNEDVKKVARTIGCKRASDPEMLIQLFEAKFSEALKTAGKQFDFADLYNARTEFRDNIVSQIGQDLNGYYLDDCAIDYLEQTNVDHLDEENILDAEGIKKIRDLTAIQITLANKIQREKEKEIRKQDVEAQEAILELDKQLIEKEEMQKREIAAVRARELAETRKIQEEESLKAETARIAKERDLAIQTENKQRDVIVAAKNKERTEAIETEKVIRDKELGATERERIVTLAKIEKEKAVEEEKKNIQDVIRDRVAVEREVVEEQEKIKDTEAFATADREKKVALTKAAQSAEEELVRKIKGAEADKEASQLVAEKRIIEANALREAIDKEAEAKKIMADAVAVEHASIGMAEAKVMEAKADAHQKEGEAQANILEQQAVAEAKGIELRGEAQAESNRKIGRVEAELSVDRGMALAQVTEAQAIADEKAGIAEAKVIEHKALADAKGVEAKAEAMQKLDGVGKEHEEFKLRLEKDKEVELAQISIQREIAQAQAQVLSEALKHAKIDIVGGEMEFFDRITKAVSQSKYVDKIMENEHAADLKTALLGSGGKGDFQGKLRDFISQFKLSSDDIRNLTVSALIMKMLSQTQDGEKQGILNQLLNTATTLGIADKKADSLGLM